MISDCEGFERELLFGGTVRSALDSSTLIVEVHDNLTPGAGAAAP